jgi:Heparinase II/III-like protein/Heparinase II/III N-terminus
MQITKIPRYIYNLFHFGPQKSFAIVQSRLKDKWNSTYWRYLASQNKAAHNWPEIAKRLKKEQPFITFFMHLKKKDFSFLNQMPKPKEVIAVADRYVQNQFDVLGSGNVTFEQIPWHADFRLQQQNASADYLFDANCYYKDFQILPKNENAPFNKDIKVPWELSRFQQIWYLGHAFKQTSDNQYAQTFYKHISSWLEANQFLLGPNWLCPMEVGIRALNWIIGFSFFKDAQIDEAFWHRFICSLYDHFIYLENNWEIYDTRTSNHYLSNLIAYFYLCYLFQDLSDVERKAEWCYQELLREIDKQIFEEGTCYEGSTRYHLLVTEICYYFYLLAPAFGFVLPVHFLVKFRRMFDFIDWCTPVNGSLIQVGDDDSGIIVAGIPHEITQSMKNKRHEQVKHFLHFGISIYKTTKWHVSLRHHAYDWWQPSGHYHNDSASITLTIDGVELFIDPGSFIYTPSSVWRNTFRSVTAHNTFYIEGNEPVLLNGHLFAIDMKEASAPTVHEIDHQTIILETFHEHYERFGLRAQRTVACDEINKQLIITDQWEHINKKQVNNVLMGWNFTLSPRIELQKTEMGWLLKHNAALIAEFSSPLTFECIDGWYSPSYGKKVPCKQLRAQAPLSFDKKVITLCFLG